MIVNNLVLILSILSSAQGDASNRPSTPSEVLSNMFAHYATAKTVVGTISMTQTANGAAVHTNTELQFDRPSQLYLRQVRDGNRGRRWLVTSDGVTWSYDRPDSQIGGYGKPRYVEHVTQHRYSMNLSDFLSAASQSLGDMNPMLISAISSPDWMKHLTAQWASLELSGKVTLDGKSVSRITGQFRETPSSIPSGTFEIFVTDSGDFVRYTLHQRMMFPKISQDPIDVSTVWNSNLKVGAQTDQNLYRVVTAG